MASQDAPLYDRRGSRGATSARHASIRPHRPLLAGSDADPLSIHELQPIAARPHHAAGTCEACQPLMSASISHNPAPRPGR
jgi:hypothetical protein